MISTTEKLKEVLREIAYRQYVYPRLIENGKLNRDTAARRIATMQEIANDLQQQLEKECLL